MRYEPIKKFLGGIFGRAPFLRILYYKLLDLLLLRAWHIRRELRKLKKDLPAEARVLDAGAGYGQYSYFMSGLAKDWKITAVDIMEDQVKECNIFFKRIGRDDRVVCDKGDLTAFQKADTYDLILSVDVMEHIADDVKVFRNFYTSLKIGGMVLLSTPSDLGGSDVHGEEDSSFIEEHVRDGYNIRGIEEKLRFAGFTGVDIRYSYGLPGKISWRISMKWPVLMLNAGKLFLLLLPFYYLITLPVVLLLNTLDVLFKHDSGTGLIVKAKKEV